MGNRNQHSLIPLGNSRPIVFLLPTIMLSTQGPLEAFTPYTNYRGPGLRGTWRAPSIVIEMKRKEKGKGKKRKKEKGKKKKKKKEKKEKRIMSKTKPLAYIFSREHANQQPAFACT